MYINNTRSSTAGNCLRDYFWTSEFQGRGLTSKWRDENLDWGAIMHVGLAHLYSDKPLLQSHNLMVNYAKEFLNFDLLDWEEKNKWIDHFEWMERILVAYDEWRIEKDDFTVVQIESEGCVVLGEICYKCGRPYPAKVMPATAQCKDCQAEIHSFVFRIDQLVNRGGAYKIQDHKTAKSAGKNYIESWEHSLQMIGYTYGAKKIIEQDIGGYGVNVIRKLKTVGTDAQTLKQCPTCHNGVKKKVGCKTCNGEGKVEKENNPSAEPFLRLWYSTTEDKEDLFLRNRLRVIQDIQREQTHFCTEPDAAWPMNPKSCYTLGKCPFIKLCYDGDPEKWYEPNETLLETYTLREPDYVTKKAMISEELD